MYMYINTCEQGYQSTSFLGKYKEYIFTPTNICFEIIMSIWAEIPMMNKQTLIRLHWVLSYWRKSL